MWKMIDVLRTRGGTRDNGLCGFPDNRAIYTVHIIYHIQSIHTLKH